MFAPFLPFTSQRLREFFGYETQLFGEQYAETVKDSLGEHTVLRYRGVEGLQWKPSELKPDAGYRKGNNLTIWHRCLTCFNPFNQISVLDT
jgi:hypothetical protein